MFILFGLVLFQGVLIHALKKKYILKYIYHITLLPKKTYPVVSAHFLKVLFLLRLPLLVYPCAGEFRSPQAWYSRRDQQQNAPENRLNPKRKLAYMGVSWNGGFFPQIIPCFIGFSIIFTIHFGVFPPKLKETPISYIPSIHPFSGANVPMSC